MLRLMITLGLVLVTACLNAEVRIVMNDTDVFVNHDAQQAGQMTFILTDDDFASASPETPLYVKITWSHQAVNAHTLVAPPNGEGDHRPVFLPLRANERQITAPAEAVSLVRAVRGEHAVWLKIQHPSSTWIEDGPPTPYSVVDFNLGRFAAYSDGLNRGYFDLGLANLPGARRDLDQLGQGYSISTLNCVDLRSATLGEEEWLKIETEVFDHTTLGVTTASNEADIVPGNQVQVTFSGNNRPARGVGIAEPWVITTLVPPTVQPICIEHHRPSDNDRLTSMVTRHAPRVFHYTEIYAGSRIVFQMQPDASYGARVAVDAFEQPILSRSVDGMDFYQLEGVGLLPEAQTSAAFDTPADAVFDLNGTLMTHQVVMQILETSESTATFPLYMEIFTSKSNPVTQPTVEATVFLAPRNHHFPDPPFDGTGDDGDPNTGVTADDQALFCAKPEIQLDPLEFVLGTFVDNLCPSPSPTRATYITPLPQVWPDQHLRLTFTRDHNVTQHLSLTYTAPDGAAVNRILVLDRPTLSVTSEDPVWFDAQGDLTPFPAFGGRLCVQNADHLPFHLNAALVTSTDLLQLPFSPDIPYNMSREQRIPSFQTETVELVVSAGDHAGSVSMIGLNNTAWYTAETPVIPKGSVRRINLKDLDWRRLSGSGTPGENPLRLSFKFNQPGMQAVILAVENGVIRALPQLAYQGDDGQSQGIPVIAPIRDTGDTVTLRLTSTAVGILSQTPTVTLELWENPFQHWFVTLHPFDTFTTLTLQQMGDEIVFYDASADMIYPLTPGPETTQALFASQYPAELRLTSNIKVHAELFNPGETYGAAQHSRNLLEGATYRVAYAPRPGQTHELLVNNLNETAPKHLLFFTETDGDVFQVALSDPEAGARDQRLDQVQLVPGGVIITRGDEAITLIPEQLRGNGSFYDAPAVVESMDGALLTLITRTDGITAPVFTAGVRVNDAVLAFESKPLMGDNQVTLTSLVEDLPYTLIQEAVFENPETFTGVTQPGGRTVVDTAWNNGDQTFTLAVGESDAPDALTATYDRIVQGYLDVSAGPDQILTEETATFTARVNAEGVDPETIEWAWYHNDALVGEGPQLTTGEPGLYRIEVRHGEQRFIAWDEVWLLTQRPGGITTPYLPQWGGNLDLLDLVGMVNTLD